MVTPSDSIAVKPILYVEDDADDIASMERSFARVGIKNPLHCIADANEAFAFVSRKVGRQDTVGAALVLLDLNLPRGSGFDLLKRIRSTPPISAVPVIVVTGSHRESDVQRASMLGANGYLIKPDDPEALVRIVKTMRDYWLENDQFIRRVSSLAFREIRAD